MSAVLVPPASHVLMWVKYLQLSSLCVLNGKFKLSIIAGSLKLQRRVVNVYVAITLIVVGIYRAPVPLGSIPALLCRFMGGLEVLLMLLLVFHFVTV